MYNYMCYTNVPNLSKAFTRQDRASTSIFLRNALRNEGLPYLRRNDYAKNLSFLQNFH